MMNSLGSALVEQGRSDEAIRHYEQSIELRPNYAAAHANRGLALLELETLRRGLGRVRVALAKRSAIARQLEVFAAAVGRNRTCRPHDFDLRRARIGRRNHVRHLLSRRDKTGCPRHHSVRCTVGAALPALVSASNRAGHSAGRRTIVAAAAKHGDRCAVRRGIVATVPSPQRRSIPSAKSIAATRGRESRCLAGKIQPAWCGNERRHRLRTGDAAEMQSRRGTLLETWRPILTAKNVQCVNLQSGGDQRREIAEVALQAVRKSSIRRRPTINSISTAWRLKLPHSIW